MDQILPTFFVPHITCLFQLFFIHMHAWKLCAYELRHLVFCEKFDIRVDGSFVLSLMHIGMHTIQQCNLQEIFKMEMERNFSFLSSIDTKKFTTNESKKQIQSTGTIEFRNTSQRSTQLEINVTHSFPLQTLITNIEIVCTTVHIFETNFQNVQIEVSSLSSRGHYGELLNFKLEKQGNVLNYCGFGFTHSIKINLVVRSQGNRRKSVRQNQKQLQDYMQKLMGDSIKEINLYGVAINSNPSSILLTKLLNISQLFKKYNLLQETAQTDTLAALSLINARRFVMAAEILRKVSKFYVEKYNSSKSLMDLNRTERSFIRDVDDQGGQSTNRSNFGGGRIIQGSKFLYRAAKIQLLLAQTISHPSLVLEKLEAYHRCNCYASGNTTPIPLRPDSDLEDVALTIFPQIVNFLLKVLSDKLEPFRIAALKSIQFFIQTLGCSIGMATLQILKEVITTYPNNFSPQINPNRIPYGLQQMQLISQKVSEQTSGTPAIKNKMLIDHYHHLLQTLLSLMSLINKKMILSMFSEIIIPSILSKNLSYELKLYLLRFSEKSISISGADLNIQVSFIGLLLSFCQQKSVSKHILNSAPSQKGQKSSEKRNETAGTSHNKHIIHNIVHFSQKILSSLKIKVLPRYSGQKMESFLEWINKTLTYLRENQILSNTNLNHSFFVFSTILDFIVSIYSVLRYDGVRLNFSPIETILYFANLAICNQQTGLPFEKILQSLVVLLKYHCKMDKNFEIDIEIVSRILQKSKQHNLSLKQLQILIKILEIINSQDSIMLQWLQVYLGSIPHSTYDETYKVFCIMVEKGMNNIQKYPKKNELLVKIVKTLLDQYTVKGKAHQQAKEVLIQSLIKNKPSNILDLIQVCLFQNAEPKPQNYYSSRKPRISQKIKKDIDHRFDSKSYKIDYEMFIEKISLAQLILTAISNEHEVCKSLIQLPFIEKFFQYVRSMIETQSQKLKSKALSLINHYLLNTVNSWKDKIFQIKPFSLIVKHVFSLCKILITKLKESKLVYSPIYSIINLFRCYEVEGQQADRNQQKNIEKLYQETEQWLKNQDQIKITKSKGQKMLNLILVREFLKLWPNLGLILNSSWQNVREIYILLIVQIFKQGLHCLPQALKKKSLQMLKPLMSNLFKSPQHTERQAGLKIFGCLLGLRGTLENKNNKLGQIVSENLKYLKPYADKVFDITYDWDEMNTEIAENLCQICLSEQTRSILNERRKEILCRRGFNMQSSYLSFNLEQQINFQKKNSSLLFTNHPNNMQSLIFRQSWLIDQQSLPLEQVYCPTITEELLYKIVQFKNMIEKEIQARTEVFGEKESFMEQNQEQFYDMGEERAQSLEAKDKSEDDQLEFQDLGIIELDDEQSGQQQDKQQKAIQKLPMKKLYKLSPNVFNASKPQRIRSKRFHQNQFDYREKIIVDELEQKIAGNTGDTDNRKNERGFQGFRDGGVAGGGLSKSCNIEKEREFYRREKEKEQEKRQEKVQKKEHARPNFMQPMIPMVVQDFQLRDQDEQFEQNEIQNPKQREKTQKRDKDQQKQSQKKPKKPKTRKRKASVGK